MRTRKKIEEEIMAMSTNPNVNFEINAVIKLSMAIEVLLDIRELLMDIKNK